MPAWYPDNSQSIGRTPLVRINHISQGLHATLLVKIESRNPSYSVKCRVGAAMVWAAERKGLLTPGKVLLEATSGNSGIALAAVAAARGIPITLTMPDNMSQERRTLLLAYGANLLLTDGALGMRAAVEQAEAMAAADPDHYLLLEQFKNPANPAIHEQTTGPEIWRDSGGKVDIFVAGVGTGGTITGVSRYLKNHCGKPVLSVAVEPAGSPVLSQTRAGLPLQAAAHGIQGIGAGFVPQNLDLALIDLIESVEDDEAIAYTRRLAKEEGIMAGISSGAALAVAVRLAKSPEHAGKTIVAVLPDSGERYLSWALFGE
ncbi:Cysteine synthase (EC 2.5.1.47) [Methylomonas albis]|uniref:Cysteine synthase n=1 Tax=Methylomonas albis TaxID=1854563 RepID=A0ABR9CX88_9GAMM|nr:cysteine synthase A [Methylomonas albis]MBD9355487.1 cysteine synthase A [Methylomonas albis]CAD6878478.1 Cysteine synthase (EC 2.5.1.47) [Methylomonas albis]